MFVIKIMASKIRREMKNVVYNYTDAEAMVREATSNDPWGPSTSVMSELSDYTYNVQAYTLVMGMLWKRLNDSGKNWRHVYKALVLLEYLIKTGSHRVSQQCKDNLFSIQTLKDFQFIDKDEKDHGASVRDKAKQLVALLKDDKTLQEERERAMHSREKIHDGPGHAASGEAQTTPAAAGTGAKKAHEELQLQLALKMSKEQADKDAALLKEEEESLKVAIALSEAEVKKEGDAPQQPQNLLLDLDFSAPAPTESHANDPWGASTASAPPPPSYDSLAIGNANDPWAQTFLSNPWEGFGDSNNDSVNPFESAPSLVPNVTGDPAKGAGKNRVEESFLGASAAGLVDLDSLLAPLPPPVTQPVSNPFGMPAQKANNPFATKVPAPSLVELAGGNKPATYNTGSDLLPPALIPILPSNQGLYATPYQGSLYFGSTTPMAPSQGNLFNSAPAQGNVFSSSTPMAPQSSAFNKTPAMTTQGMAFNTTPMVPTQNSMFGVSPVQNSMFGATPAQNGMFGTIPAQPQAQQSFAQNNALFNPFS